VSLRSRTSLVAKLLKNKPYRDAYVVEHVRNGVPFQIRSMRDQREWTQARLGQEAKKPQNVISRLEDPNYGKLTIQTLLEIASAFDTALIVKFVPFSRLLKEFEDVSPAELSVKSILDKEEVAALEDWAAKDDEAFDDKAPDATVGTLVDIDTIRPINVNRLIAPSQSEVTGQLAFGFKAIRGAAPSLEISRVQKASITTTKDKTSTSLVIGESTNRRIA
jgi:transcriptional regulator with XRE-family HTH domain